MSTMAETKRNPILPGNTRRDLGTTAIQAVVITSILVLISSLWWSLAAAHRGPVDGLLFLLQSAVDVTIAQAAGLVGGLMGLSLMGFSTALRLIRTKGRRILNRFLVCLLAAVVLRLFSAYMAVMQDMVYSTFAIRSVIIVGAMGAGISSAWTLYYRYVVWTDEERSHQRTESLLRRELDKGAHVRRLMGKGFHRDHLLFPLVISFLIYGVSLFLAIWVGQAQRDASSEIIWALPVCFPLVVLWGVGRRLFDGVRPWGKRGLFAPNSWDYADGFKSIDPEPVIERKKKRAKRNRKRR